MLRAADTQDNCRLHSWLGLQLNRQEEVIITVQINICKLNYTAKRIWMSEQPMCTYKHYTYT